MNNFLIYFQIITGILLIVSILLQQKGQALGSVFGGEGSVYTTKRGIQKKLFWATVVLGSLFILFSLLKLFF